MQLRSPRLLGSLVLSLFLCSRLLGMDHGRPPDLHAFAAADSGAITPGNFLPDFRLTDHTGATRELYYASNTKVVVLVFTAAGSPRGIQTAAALRALRARFAASDVTLWQIDSNLAADRTTIAAEQSLYNNSTPVLIDDAQLVATEVGATRQLETLVVQVLGPTFFQLAYRGPLDNADPTTLAAPTQNFAADAVAAVLAGTAPAQPTVALPITAPALDLPPAVTPNYATDVAPVVIRRCIQCHSPGNIAPYSYSKYDDLVPHALEIRADLLVKRMAPWHADSQYGVFVNGGVLTPAESAALYNWARAGAPRGTGVDPLPSAPPPPSGDWPLGQPDVILTIPKQSIPATGIVDYRYISVTAPTAVGKWLRAAVVKPGNVKVVHHALLFDGSLLDVLLASGGLGGFFAGYVPGLDQIEFPADTGKLLHGGGQLTFQMHYTTDGQAETDQTQVGLYYYNGTPSRELFTKAAANSNFTIPPQAGDYPIAASFTPSLTKDVLLYELNPHMHLRGKRMRLDAVYPNGSSETLVNVPQYDFAWQSGYRLAQPKRLPAGTTIQVNGAFDNSAQNPANPNPNASVQFGEQTTDEMFIGYVNYAELSDHPTVLAPVFANRLAARARVGSPFTLQLGAANTPTAYRSDPLPPGLALNAATGLISGTPTTAARLALVVYADNSAGTAAATLDLVVSDLPAVPVFAAQPQSVRTNLGASVTLTAAVTGAGPLTYEWYFNGSDFCGTSSPTLSLNNITAAYAGDYVCVASNATGSVSSTPATLSLEFSGLVNLSARANVGTGAAVVIPGITVRGGKPKTLLIRAVGPTLGSFGVGGALVDPVLNLFDASNQNIVVNDNWGDVPNVGALISTSGTQGAFGLANGSRDAAALVTLAPGSYTVQVAGNGTGSAATGVALVEVYDADGSPSTLVNLSCRAQVGTGGNALFAGFAIGGSQSRRLLIRAIGPTLANFGLAATTVLAAPQLDVFDSKNVRLATNSGWGGGATLATAFSSVGAFGLAAGSKDAAVIVTLPPGSYSAQVTGVGNTTGLALVEVYDLP